MCILPNLTHSGNCLDLGCDYFRELNMSGNAKYHSHRMIEEWLTILSNEIEDLHVL